MAKRPIINPVFLAGGSGTRLWPISRKSYPKQFVRLSGDLTLFQQCALRMKSTEELAFAPPVTVTNPDFRFIVTDQLQSVGTDPGAILIEPEGKNTAPAVLAACLHALKNDPEAVLLVSPVDHAIPDTAAFHMAIKQGVTLLQKGMIITFGISPTRAETGYGYLQFSKAKINPPLPLIRFVEKPNAIEAQKMLEDGSYLWNAGIFLFRACDMVDAFHAHAPHLVNHVEDAVNMGHADLGFWRLAPEAWSKCESVSIDYAIMEKVKNLAVVPFSKGWSDLGDWHSIWLERNDSQCGVVTQGNVTDMGCKDVLLWSESSSQKLVGLGLEDIVAVATPDAVLVASKEKTNDIKLVVEELKNNGAPQAENFPLDHRPWGWFESLAIDNGFQVKRIHVKPGASLSLQSHKFRSEHWIVVEGVATVTVDETKTDLEKGYSIFVPTGAVHRLENNGTQPMVLIEVQTGSYLGEDDIVRYEDKYRRT